MMISSSSSTRAMVYHQAGTHLHRTSPAYPHIAHPLPELTGLRHLAKSRRVLVTPHDILLHDVSCNLRTIMQMPPDSNSPTINVCRLRVCVLCAQICPYEFGVYPLPYPHFVGCNACLAGWLMYIALYIIVCTLHPWLHV